MSDILYLVHRLPYPPDKGDKVRSYHLLRYLAQRHRVFLGTFVDDPADTIHVATLQQWCAEVHAAPLSPIAARLKSLSGLLNGQPLTLPYYQNRELQSWVDRVCVAENIDLAVVFSAAMAQYLDQHAALPALVDFVDVDSAKWTQYGSLRRWPLSWLYRREGIRLLRFERRLASVTRRSFFVTEQEAELFRSLAPEAANSIEVLNNGVDCEYFSPDISLADPFVDGEKAIVFTGAMDYWPNIDAVTWFVRDIFPLVRAELPIARFYIVGRDPVSAVRKLAGESVVVTGTVIDVRPYLRHSAVVVAPLRIARGIQNKVLEAMAMGCTVVGTEACMAAIDAKEGAEMFHAGTADKFAELVVRLVADLGTRDAIGRAARAQVVGRYGWEANLAKIEQYFFFEDKKVEQ